MKIPLYIRVLVLSVVVSVALIVYIRHEGHRGLLLELQWGQTVGQVQERLQVYGADFLTEEELKDQAEDPKLKKQLYDQALDLVPAKENERDRVEYIPIRPFTYKGIETLGQAQFEEDKLVALDLHFLVGTAIEEVKTQLTEDLKSLYHDSRSENLSTGALSVIFENPQTQAILWVDETKENKKLSVFLISKDFSRRRETLIDFSK